jgi:hypothetical protein
MPSGRAIAKIMTSMRLNWDDIVKHPRNGSRVLRFNESFNECGLLTTHLNEMSQCLNQPNQQYDDRDRAVML